MARFKDWVELARNTVSSFSSNDMNNLYSQEWPETRKMLVAGHGDEIEREKGQVRRFIRTWSAVLFGLAQRLAPTRRIIFFVAFAMFILMFIAILSDSPRESPGDFALLALSFLGMVFLLAMELIDKIKYRDELVLARELQASLVPATPPQPEGFEIAAFNHIANTVGGDIYDFAELADGRVAVLFGDASGHGMAAGLVMAVAHAAFRTQLDIDPRPQAIISGLNRTLCRTGTSRSFFACCYVLLDRDGNYEASVAGHPSILVATESGAVRDRIGKGSYPLGVKTAITWEVTGGRLEPGERLVFHSDGLTETRSANGTEMGDALLEAMVGWNAAATAQQLLETIVGEWRSYSGGRPAEDDVSVAVIRRVR